VGALAVNFKVTDVDTAGLDHVLMTPGLLAQALGPTVSFEASAEAPSKIAEKVSLTASFVSPALKSAQPLRATITPERIGLDAPFVVSWTMSPEFGNAQLLGAQAAPDGSARAPPAARFAEPTNLTLSINRLAMGSRKALLRPDVFALDMDVQAPAVGMTVGENTPARFGALKMRVGEQRQQGSIGYTLRVNAAESPGGSAGAPVDVSGGVHGLADEQGRLTLDRAVLNAKVAANEFPSALVDALARQHGLLAEALGPTVTLDVQASGVPLRGGTDAGAITAKLTSPRSAADLKGSIRDGMFVAQMPITARLTVVTPELGGRLVKGLPQVAAFQKTAEDGAAALTAKGMTIPVDGDLSKLNGDITFDLGQVRFETSGKFRSLLKTFEQREAGLLGQKVEPFHAVFDKGVMTYDQYRIPIGEFSLETVGKVDFVNRTLDVVTFIPLGALTDEALGLFKTGFGGALSELNLLGPTTMLPWRTRGSFDDPQTHPAPKMYLENVGRKLNPLEILRNLGERIEGDRGGR
jgi:hypothetical protein